jgi:hypothetical protein
MHDVDLFHAEGSALISLLRDALTFFDVGKAFATSGSKTTTLVPPRNAAHIFRGDPGKNRIRLAFR